MKKVVAVALLVVMCVSLCSCGNDVEKKLQEGIWGDEYYVFGSKVLQEYEFTEDGRFICMFYIDGKFGSLDMGTYEIGKTQIFMTYDSGESFEIDYTYKSGKLTLEHNDNLMYNRTAKA